MYVCIVSLQFSLLYGFWNYLFSSVNINILIIGVDNAGKTVRVSPLICLHTYALIAHLILLSLHLIRCLPMSLLIYNIMPHTILQTLLERIKAQFGAPHQHSIPPDRIPPTIGMNRK